MIGSTWTARCARMLLAELFNLVREEEEQFAESVATHLDGGTGAMAVAAIAACTPGPRRDLEVAIWAKRFADDTRQAMALGIRRDMTVAEQAALRDLASKLMNEHGWQTVTP